MAIIVTASLRATAITAFFLAALPPLVASLSPWRRRAQEVAEEMSGTLDEEFSQAAVAAF